MAFSVIRPYQHVILRLPSDTIKVEQLLPNTLVNLGKYGSFRTNNVFGRPYHLTFEVLDRAESREGQELRVVPAAELHAAALLEEAETEDGQTPVPESGGNGPHPVSKSNANITDDPNNQQLTMTEIEALKQDETGTTRELIAKIMQSHSKLDQKTAFSLAKYTLRKNKKYLKQFCILPLDVASLTDYMMAEKDFSKIMEMRNEAIGLIGCWANIHADSSSLMDTEPSSRYLIVDDTGGIIVAALAERMGVLHQMDLEVAQNGSTEEPGEADPEEHPSATAPHKPRRQQYSNIAMSATTNSITLVHANQQPNLALLRYFNFDSNNPPPSHPLYKHLKTVSWLQLIEPESDTTYQEPAEVPPEELATYKSSRRSTYFRKRRRWERAKSVIDEARAGGFNGLVVASYTNPVSILRRLVPLLAGGSQVVVYSPHIEPLAELADLYSTARRTAFLSTPEEERNIPSTDFPVDPTLLLSPMVQTSRVRKWQVLPGRTHPLMMGKGGAEGYIFAATRVLPAEGKVTARGKTPRGKKNKTSGQQSVVAESQDASEEETTQVLSKKPKIEESDEVATGTEDIMQDTTIDIKVE